MFLASLSFSLSTMAPLPSLLLQTQDFILGSLVGGRLCVPRTFDCCIWGTLDFHQLFPNQILKKRKKAGKARREKKSIAGTGRKEAGTREFLALTCGNADSASFPKGGPQQDHKEPQCPQQSTKDLLHRSPEPVFS